MGHSTLTLKLDASYRPVGVIDAVEAFVLCLVGKATSVENYGKKINTVNRSFTLPAVIILHRVIKFRLYNLTPNRRNILLRDNNECQYCQHKFPPPELTIDHVIPKSRGGTNTWLNLVASCKSCNQKKGDKLLSDSAMKLSRKPYAPKYNILSSLLCDSRASDLWSDYLWDKS